MISGGSIFASTRGGKCRTKDARGESSVEDSESERNGKPGDGLHKGAKNIPLCFFMLEAITVESMQQLASLINELLGGHERGRSRHCPKLGTGDPCT